MLKDIVDKYTISKEDADEPLDEVKVEEEEIEETERENETQDEQADKAEEAEADETDDEVAAEEEAGDTTVLEAPTDEQGEVTTAETEEVVSEVTPEPDVEEAGDDIGQGTPEDAFEGTTDQADITAGSDEDIPLAGTDDSKAVESVVTEGAEVAQGQATIIQQAETTAAEIEGGEAAASDVNGNAITEEEAEVNKEEAEVAAEIDAEADEEVTATDVVAEETPLEEAEALADELTDEVKEEAEESTDDTLGDDTASGGDDFDAGGDTGSNVETGGESPDDSFDDDDTPLEGAESDSEVPDTDAVVEEEVSEESTDDLPAGDTPDTEVTEGDTTDVQESVDDQNLAADVTAEAASSDVNETEDLKGNTTVDDAIDTIPEDATQPDDDEPLEVDVTDTFKDKEVDGNPSYSDNHQDDTAPTVQETIDNPDGTEESLAKDISDDAVVDNDDLEASVTEEEAEETDTSLSDSTNDPTTDASDGIDDVDQESQIGDKGEIEDVTPEADFAEGEVDIPDVDTETTDEEVAEAEVAADDEDVKADYDQQLAEDAEKTVEELQHEAKGLEHLIERLTTGIANEKYDATVVAEAFIVGSKLQKAFGDDVKVITLEDYGHNDLDLAYVASLESLRGFSSRIGLLVSRLTDKLEIWWASPMVTKVVKRSEAINVAADKALVDIKGSSFNGGEVKGISGYIATNETGLIKAISDDLKSTTGIATKGLTANEKLLDNVVTIVDDIIAARKPEDIGRALKQVKNLTSTKASYPNEVFKKGLLMGNWKLEMKDGSVVEAGIPVAVKETSGDRKTTFNLTKADLANLVLMAKTYAAIARKAAETVGDKAVKEKPSLSKQRERALPYSTSKTRVSSSHTEEKEIDDLVDQLIVLSKSHHDMYEFVVKHALDTAEALLGVVKKAI